MNKLRVGTPEEAGFDAGRIALIGKRLAEWMDGERNRSAVLLAARRGIVALHEAFGPRTHRPADGDIAVDSIFTMASLSKPVIAAAAMVLVEQGRLALHRPLRRYLPELCGAGTQEILVSQLFTHTSGFDEDESVAMSDERLKPGADPGERQETQHPFVAMCLANKWDLRAAYTPGREMSYCNHNYVLIGELVRRASGRRVEDFTREVLFDPLGMHDSSFVQDPTKLDRWVQRGPIDARGSNPDDPMLGLEGRWNQRAPWGHSGLNSTAADMAAFSQMFLNGGVYNGRRILSEATIRAMTTNQVPGIGTDFIGWHDEASWGLGWVVQDVERWRWMNGTLQSVGTYYHSGAGGHQVWVDPIHEVVGVYLSVCLDVNEETGEHYWQADAYQNMVTAAIA